MQIIYAHLDSLPRCYFHFRAARAAKGLTWYAVAKRAGIPRLSNVAAVAQALGLRLELVEERV